MFKKCVLAKFEWKGQPEEITDIFIENLILHSSDNNFVVCDFVSMRGAPESNGEIWRGFNVLEHEPKYGIPKKINVTNYIGETYSPPTFVLFNQFRNTTTLNISYINYYSQMIAQINKALNQHIVASNLVATIYASSAQEKKSLEDVFKMFDGVKIVQHAGTLLDGGKKADIVQFDIPPRLEELERLKHEIENDLFIRLGIDHGMDKTHMTNVNLKDSEQPIALINSYELKLREDFCRRYNKWRGKEILSVKIHTISKENTINNEVEENNNNVNDNGRDKAVSDSAV